MRLREFNLLTDENIHPGVLQFLRSQGFDVLDVKESRLVGADDEALIQKSIRENRLIVTHDSDFGKLAVVKSEPVVGIIYLRPGHIMPEFTITTIRELLKSDFDLTPPFILVAERSASRIQIRIRPLGPS